MSNKKCSKKINNIIKLLNNNFILSVKEYLIKQLIKNDISSLDINEKRRLCKSSIVGIVGDNNYNSEDFSIVNELIETVIKYFYGLKDINDLSLLSDFNSISNLLGDSLIEKIYGVKSISDVYDLIGLFLTDIKYNNYVKSYVNKKINSFYNNSLDSLYGLFNVLLSINISFNVRKYYIDMLFNNRTIEDRVNLVCYLLDSGTSNLSYLFSLTLDDLIKSNNVSLIIKFLTSYYSDKSLYKDIYSIEINTLILLARKMASMEELESLCKVNNRFKDFRLDGLDDSERIKLLRSSVKDDDYKSLEYKIISKSDTLDDSIKGLYINSLNGTCYLNSLLFYLERVLTSSNCNLDNEMYQYTLLVILKNICSYKNINMTTLADRFLSYFLVSDIITIKSIKIIDLLLVHTSRDNYINLFYNNLINVKNNYGLVIIIKLISYMKNSYVYANGFIRYLFDSKNISDDEIIFLTDYIGIIDGIDDVMYKYIVDNIDSVNYNLIIRFINKSGNFDLLSLTKRLLSRSDIKNKDVMLVDILINSSVIESSEDIIGFLSLIGFDPDRLKSYKVNCYIKSLLSGNISNSGYDKAVYLLSYLFKEKYNNNKRLVLDK